jgi:hypothetical protein
MLYLLEAESRVRVRSLARGQRDTYPGDDRGSAHDSELEDGHAAHDRSRGDDGDDDRSLPAPASAGLISIGDVVKARIMQAEQDVDSLRTYVAHSA